MVETKVFDECQFTFYSRGVIGSFRHKGLRLLFEDDDGRKLKADQLDRLRLILSALNAAEKAEDMGQPTFRLHPVKGDRKGSWAVTVRANWRVTFRFVESRAVDVDLTDYHLRGNNMTMKNPVHPGKLVEANLEELNLSVADAAKAMKVTRQQLHNVISGRSAISPDMALRFEKAFGGSASMWLGMQSAYDLAQARKEQGRISIRRLGDHRAGVPVPS